MSALILTYNFSPPSSSSRCRLSGCIRVGTPWRFLSLAHQVVLSISLLTKLSGGYALTFVLRQYLP